MFRELFTEGGINTMGFGDFDQDAKSADIKGVAQGFKRMAKDVKVSQGIITFTSDDNFEERVANVIDGEGLDYNIAVGKEGKVYYVVGKGGTEYDRKQIKKALNALLKKNKDSDTLS